MAVAAIAKVIAVICNGAEIFWAIDSQASSHRLVMTPGVVLHSLGIERVATGLPADEKIHLGDGSVPRVAVAALRLRARRSFVLWSRNFLTHRQRLQDHRSDWHLRTCGGGDQILFEAFRASAVA